MTTETPAYDPAGDYACGLHRVREGHWGRKRDKNGVTRSWGTIWKTRYLVVHPTTGEHVLFDRLRDANACASVFFGGYTATSFRGYKRS